MSQATQSGRDPSSGQTPGGTPGEAPGGARGHVLEAMARYAGPAEGFMPQLLAGLCQVAGLTSSGGSGAGLGGGAALLVAGEQGAWSCRAAYPEAGEQQGDGGAWLGHVQRTVELQTPRDTCRLPLYRGANQQAVGQVLLTPLRQEAEGPAKAVLCLRIERSDEMAGLAAMGHVEHAAQIVARYELAQAMRRRDQQTRGMAQAMQCLEVVNREPKFRPAGIGLCNQIAETWKASRVSVGFMAGQTMKLKAMSHTEDIIRKMQLVQDLEAAMEECVDQDSEVLVPQPESATTINRQAKLYTEKHGPAHLCILPLRLQDKVVGAMAVEWPPGYALRMGEVESLRLTANLFTARLHQFHLDDRWLGARMATSLRKGAAVAVGPKHTWAKLVAIAVCGFLAFAFFVNGDDTVDASFAVQTTGRQVIAAPFEGTLLSIGAGIEVNEPVVGGDQAGQVPTVLAQLDTSELRVERAAVLAQIADFQAQADAARGENDLAGVEVALANVRRLRAQADLYDYRIERSTLTSPTSGVIIEGDLKQRINGVLDKGEVLFEIAPLDALRGELLVPANRIGDVRSRLSHPDNPSRGELASVSHPGAFIGFTVERIEPEAEVVDGENIFRVRVSLDEVTDWLRPGVEGRAKVHVARHSYAYLWTRDAVNWVRMKLWL